jgi:hypothetical protein
MAQAHRAVADDPYSDETLAALAKKKAEEDAKLLAGLRGARPKVDHTTFTLSKNPAKR